MKSLLRVILFVTVVLTFLLSSGLFAADEDYWPDSWFEAPKIVSELGIKEFNQSPVLDTEVDINRQEINDVIYFGQGVPDRLLCFQMHIH